MKLKILTFGIAKDIVGKNNLTIDVDDATTVKELKKTLKLRYPRFAKMSDFLIAVNTKYSNESQKIKAHDEIAIIPPTNGG